MGRSLNEILAQEKPEVVARAKEKAADILLDIHLAELRKMMDCTQSELAATLGISQPTIAGMERQGQDIKLSTLKKYVEGLGGKMSFDIELSDGSHYGFNL